MGQLLQDIRYGLRSLRGSPGFTATAVITLALGIGANAAIFSVLNAVVLSPLPYDDPGRLVVVQSRYPFTLQLLEEFGDRVEGLPLGGYTTKGLTLIDGGPPQAIPVGVVSGGHFSLLGRQPALGRDLAPNDETSGEPVVILSHGLWQSAFAGDPSILGRQIVLRGEDTEHRTVVGVMPADYRPLVGPVRAWVPHRVERGSHDYADMYELTLIGRLAPEVTAVQAADRVRRAGEAIRAAIPDHLSEAQLAELQVTTLLASVVSGVRPTMWILQAAVGIVLLIGCANVANLILARATYRSGEIAVRHALGAGRLRLVRQLLTESALLGLIGGAAGLLLANLVLGALLSRLPDGIPRTGEIRLDSDIVLASLALSLLASFLFGLVPAMRSTGASLQLHLHQSGRGTGAGRSRMSAGLVAAEIALSVVLVASAGLMLKSVWRLQQVEPGFRVEGVLTMRLLPPTLRYEDDADRQRYYDQVLDRVRAVPGVSSAEAIDVLPMKPGAIGLVFLAEGHEPTEKATFASYRTLSAGYFKQMAIPIVHGRDFTDADRAGAVEVGILNRTMAERLWPAEDPIGKEIRWNVDEPWFTVVGVSADVKQDGLDGTPYSVIHRPYAQEAFRPNLYLTVRSARDPAALTATVRAAVWEVDAEVPIVEIQTMPDVVRHSVRRRRFVAGLLGSTGILALLLAGIGVYGVMAYSVNRQTREIGIRMALGADRRVVLGGVLRRGAITALVGVVIGVAGALLTTRALSSLLFEVSATDPIVLAIVALFLALIALAASWLPARRAAAVDPMVALRNE
jgi:putative ABC transport system permease protein